MNLYIAKVIIHFGEANRQAFGLFGEQGPLSRHDVMATVALINATLPGIVWVCPTPLLNVQLLSMDIHHNKATITEIIQDGHTVKNRLLSYIPNKVTKDGGLFGRIFIITSGVQYYSTKRTI